MKLDVLLKKTMKTMFEISLMINNNHIQSVYVETQLTGHELKDSVIL